MYSKENNHIAIYKILNKINDKFYIGSCVSSKQRKNRHWNQLRQGVHFNSHLQRSVNKYGLDNFEFQIVEIVEDKFKLLEREQFYIDTLKPNYNLCPIAGSQMGVKYTKERCELMSKLYTGKGNPFYGKTHSSETIELIKRKNTENGTYDNFKKLVKVYNESHRKLTEELILQIYDLDNAGFTTKEINYLGLATTTQLHNLFNPNRHKETKQKYSLIKRKFNSGRNKYGNNT